jgi:hypothetical protein
MRPVILTSLIVFLTAGNATSIDGSVAAVREPPLQQPPAQPNKVESPTVKVLTGLTVPQFVQEMELFVQALGGSCNDCHMPKGNFASDEKPMKIKAREMIEMTRAINKQFFPDHKPAENESTLGRVTCYTCHQGETKPKSAP